jgi:hypothetical protein
VRELINEPVFPPLPVLGAHFQRHRTSHRRPRLMSQYENVLRDSGLHDAVRAYQHTAPDVRPLPMTYTHTETIFSGVQEPLSLVPTCTPAALRGGLSAFAHWLAWIDAVHAPRLAAFTAPFLHERVHRAVQRRLGRAYATLCARVRDPRARYEATATLLGMERPFGSVAPLWQFFGIDGEGGEEDSYDKDDDDDEASDSDKSG